MLEAIIIISVAVNIYFLIKYFLKDGFSRKTALSDIIADGLSHDDQSVVKMTVLLTLSARLAKADGRILSVEKETMTKHLGLGRGGFQASNSLFEAACNSKIPDKELIRVIKRLYPTDGERKDVIDLLRHIAWSDDDYHEAEQELIEKVAKGIGIDLNNL